MSSTSNCAIPLCDIQASYESLKDEIDAAVARTLASGQVILGPEVAALEREVAAYCGVKYAVGCASGSDALLLALSALGVGAGDEVILPPFTFFATVGAVCRLGATPVFADIDPETFNIDPEEVARKITSRTKAIVPVHLFGQCADMDALHRFADRDGVPLVEDACQAFGADHRGRKAGAIGEIACFSFYPSKTLGAFGDGGMAVTNDPDHARRMAALRVHGMEPKYHHHLLGWNARLDAVQAAMLRVKLPHVENWISARRLIAERYDELIDSMELGDLLQKPVRHEFGRHTFSQYVVRVAGSLRDGLLQYLQSKTIGCEVYYPVPLHLQECLWNLGHAEGDFPVSEEASRSVLALPIFPELTAEQQRRVIGECAAFIRQQVAVAA